ncbi:response regulator [Parapedobacter deserti]|uniref:Response regulator n=1 Tax=Parapedobacter deserti TaxID=1912957 RepID=A0ABV7JU26_9SPHI
MELSVMIIDDDNMFNIMAKVLLRNTGISADPIICTDGREALMALRQRLSPDRAFLLFLDINMPLLSGWDVLDALQKFPGGSSIFVIIVTSSIDKADRIQALRYPQVIDYLIKPLQRERLFALRSLPQLAAFFST